MRTSPKKATMPMQTRRTPATQSSLTTGRGGTPKKISPRQQQHEQGARTRVGERRGKQPGAQSTTGTKPGAEVVADAPQRKNEIYKSVQKGYLTDIFMSFSSRGVNVFTEQMCESVSAAVASLFGLSNDVYAEAEVIYPVISMFIGSDIDQHTVKVMV